MDIISEITSAQNHAAFARLVRPPARPPAAKLVYASDTSTAIAYGFQYQAQWLEDGALLKTGGREPVQWPAAVIGQPLGRYAVTIGTSVRPQGVMIQIFDTVNALGIPDKPPINRLDCALSDFESRNECKLTADDAGILTIQVPSILHQENVYISEFVSWLDNNGHDDDVYTVMVTWLYHLSVFAR